MMMVRLIDWGGRGYHNYWARLFTSCQRCTLMTSDSNRPPRGKFEEAGRRIERELQDAGRKLEAEAERLMAYLNKEVVPVVRSDSTRALRAAADRLAQLADHLEAKSAAARSAAASSAAKNAGAAESGPDPLAPEKF